MLFYNDVQHGPIWRAPDGHWYLLPPDVTARGPAGAAQSQEEHGMLGVLDAFLYGVEHHGLGNAKIGYMKRKARHGLGASDAPAIEGAVNTGLNFIPGVGPFLSAAASIIESFFGGGDPTPMTVYEHQTVQLRLQLAEAHHALGIPDSFEIPAGLDTSNAGEIATLALVIANEYAHDVPSVTLAEDTSLQEQHDVLGPKVWGAYTHDERTILKSAIAAIQSQLGSAQMQAANAQLTMPPPTVLPPPVTDAQAPPASAPQPSESAPVTSQASMMPTPSADNSDLMPVLFAGGAFMGILLLGVVIRGSK